MIKNNRQVYVQTKLIKVLQENCLGLLKEELKKRFAVSYSRQGRQATADFWQARH